jgi:hypothetical protein
MAKMKRLETKMDTKEKVFFVIALIALFGIAFSIRLGLKPTAHLTLNGGSLEINIPIEKSKVYIDNIEEYETKKNNETYSVTGLSPKVHSVAVSTKGFWPWIKNIDIPKESKVSINTFTLPQSPSITEVEKNSALYTSLISDFRKHSSAGEANKLESPNKLFNVWISNNIIFAGWLGDSDKAPLFFCESGICATRIEVLNSTQNINDVTFYNGKDDVLIFSNGDGIYVIDMDRRGTQNFQPVSTIPNSFLIGSSTTLYIKSEGSIKTFSF